MGQNCTKTILHQGSIFHKSKKTDKLYIKKTKWSIDKQQTEKKNYWPRVRVRDNSESKNRKKKL